MILCSMYKMFRFIKKCFFIRSLFLSSLVSTTPLSCISMNNQACKVRLEIINVNGNEPVFYPFSIKTSKCSRNCNNINDPFAKICVPDIVKDLNIKVFNLMSRTNETRHIKWYETCRCICRLDTIVCNNKQCWNNDKCWCKCKELIDKSVCDKGYVWNPSSCECECDKACDVGEYLDYENCKCRKNLVDKLVDECNETVDEIKIVKVKINAILAYCTLYYFQYSIQSISELLLILFTVNTWIVIKKMFLNMIMFIM